MKRVLITLSLAVLCTVAQAQESVKVHYVSLAEGTTYCSNPIKEYAQPTKIEESEEQKILVVYNDVTFQTIKGIGGCFNEIGGEALASLSKKQQDELMNVLFNPECGAPMVDCRMSIGASDFGIDAYSYSMVEGDYNMEHFSMDREKQYMMPFIKRAFEINPNINLFGSPWSPPAWMKHSKFMDRGVEFPEKNRLIDDPKIYEAYALYFAKYVEAYAAEGVKINRILIQNEQDLSTKYPSCNMPACQMAHFVQNYMRPLFNEKGIDTEIWAGTYRTAREAAGIEFAGSQKMKRGFDGIGIQYTNPEYVYQLARLAPEMPLMHTESNCYDGSNTIDQARSRFSEIANYINGGSENFCYWNIILNETGLSGWDWRQNSMITIDRDKKSVTYNPDFAPIALMAKFVKPGSVRIGSFSHQQHIMLEYNGRYHIILQNNNTDPMQIACSVGGKKLYFEVPAESLSAVEISK